MSPQSPDVEADLVLRLRSSGCVFAEEEAALLLAEAGDRVVREALVARRLSGEPLEQVLGWVEFAGLRIEVDPGVFVPRQRTAFLVEASVALAMPHRHPVVVDLCCGTGAVGVAIASRLPQVDLIAADLDPVAVTNARRNVEPVGGRVFVGDLFAALPAELRNRVDVLAVNAPYVPTGEISTMPPEARDHEPRWALDGGADGLDVHRRIAAQAATWLSRGGGLLVETSTEQAPTAAGILSEAGLHSRVEHSADRWSTVVIGVR